MRELLRILATWEPPAGYGLREVRVLHERGMTCPGEHLVVYMVLELPGVGFLELRDLRYPPALLAGVEGADRFIVEELDRACSRVVYSTIRRPRR